MKRILNGFRSLCMWITPILVCMIHLYNLYGIVKKEKEKEKKRKEETLRKEEFKKAKRINLEYIDTI